MSGNLRIAILVDERNPYPQRTPHCIWRIADVWREWGCRVEVVRGPVRPLPEVDLLIPQIDLTRTPERFRRYLDEFPYVLNRRVMDISKRVVSTNLVERDTPYDGPVIVKTDRNYGGVLEARRWWIPAELLSWVQLRRRAASRGVYRFVRAIRTGEYPIFEHRDLVPKAVWSNRHLVVERYIPERVGDFTCIRVCLVCGDVALNRRLYSRTPLIKGSTEQSEEMPTPSGLFAFREKMGIDYGKLDYVVHDGQVHVLDANRSPGILADGEVTERICRKLAAGLPAVLRSLGSSATPPAMPAT